MNCSKTRRLLSAYHDAELPAERRAAVRRHLQKCQACRTLLNGFKNLAALAGKWIDVQPSASLWNSLAPKLMSACDAAAAAVPEKVGSVTEQNQKRPNPKRCFKPVIEGLEDRYALSDLLGAWPTAIAPEPMVPAVAMLNVDGNWSAGFNSIIATGAAMSLEPAAVCFSN
jgi:anti-sigma factor RsiW